MKRIWIAVSALAIVIVLCVVENVLLTKLPNKLRDDINEVETYVVEGDYENARSKMDESVDDMENMRIVLSTFTPHTRFEYIEHNISLLSSLLDNGEYNSFLIASEQSNDLLDCIQQSERIKAENIL